jgi:PAS domain S-box-containing protein
MDAFQIIDMLNSAGHEDVSFCICDPDQDDCPIIFASDGFCNFTGYAVDEIEGRNCRFLQGPGTEKADVDKIRSAIKNEKEDSVNLLNYKKDGTSFNNEFFLSPLYGKDGRLEYYIGVQCSVKKLGPGQAPANPGKLSGIVINTCTNKRMVPPCCLFRLCAWMRQGHRWRIVTQIIDGHLSFA